MAKVLKDRSNQTIMDAIRSDMPLSYQARIPAATQAGVKNTAEQLFNYRPLLNEFVDALVNQIGSVIGQGMVWNNPLAVFMFTGFKHDKVADHIQQRYRIKQPL